MGLDWADGDYSRTATQLEPAAEWVVERLGIGAGMRVLDVGCGTGNAALAAARRGAVVTALDPAAGLLDIARERATEAGLDITFVNAAAEAAPAGGDYDVVLSIFAVIFADDPAAAALGMVEAARPGGELALTTWKPEGPVDAAARVVLGALPQVPGPVREWGNPKWVEELLVAAGARQVAFEDGRITFRAPSPSEAFADLEDHHPFWRWARTQVSDDSWQAVRRDSVRAFDGGNEDPAAFATTSAYWLVRASR